MENRRDFSHTRRFTQGNLDAKNEILKSVKGSSTPSQKKLQPSKVDTRFLEGNRTKSGMLENTNSLNTFWKATAHCEERGIDANLQPYNFNISDLSTWRQALPLFDGEEPTGGTEKDFDEIVYTKLAKLNEGKNTENKERKLHKTNQIFTCRVYNCLKIGFNIVCISIFTAILYAMYLC